MIDFNSYFKISNIPPIVTIEAKSDIGQTDRGLLKLENSIGVLYNNLSYSIPDFDDMNIPPILSKDIGLPLDTKGNVIKDLYKITLTILHGSEIVSIVENVITIRGDKIVELSKVNTFKVILNTTEYLFTIDGIPVLDIDGDTKITVQEVIPEEVVLGLMAYWYSMTVTHSYNYNFTAPNVNFDVDIDCMASQMIIIDTTLTKVPDVTLMSLSRDLLIKYPPFIEGFTHTPNVPDVPDIHDVTTYVDNYRYIINKICTLDWTIQLQLTLNYKTKDNLDIIVVQSLRKEVEVDCVTCLCEILACIYNIELQYQEYQMKGNLIKVDEYREKLQEINKYYNMYLNYASCGSTVLATKSLKKVSELVGDKCCCTEVKDEIARWITPVKVGGGNNNPTGCCYKSYSGNGVPDNLIGNDGDDYVDISTGDIYKKIDGVWVKQYNINDMVTKNIINAGLDINSDIGCTAESLNKSVILNQNTAQNNVLTLFK